MPTFVYVILAILMFGILIFIHELGHYLTARKFGVTINEFAIGMGPKIFSKTSKKTGIKYSLRAFPIGGYVDMVGENEASDTPGSFSSKKVWQRMIITSAGAFMNLELGVVIMCIIVLSTQTFASNTVAQFDENATSNVAESPLERLEIGDEIIKINGKRVLTAYDTVYAISRYATEPVNVTVIRNGEKIELQNVTFGTVEESGVLFGNRDFYFEEGAKSFGMVIKTMYSRSVLCVKMVWHSLFDLITGKYGFEQMSGPVGVISATTTAAKSGFSNFAFIFVLISVNLGIFNLLPIPALDGGRLAFQFYELIFKKPIKQSVEGYIHAIGLAILLLFMLAITFKDVINLF